MMKRKKVALVCSSFLHSRQRIDSSITGPLEQHGCAHLPRGSYGAGFLESAHRERDLLFDRGGAKRVASDCFRWAYPALGLSSKRRGGLQRARAGERVNSDEKGKGNPKQGRRRDREIIGEGFQHVAKEEQGLRLLDADLGLRVGDLDTEDARLLEDGDALAGRDGRRNLGGEAAVRVIQRRGEREGISR